jgi:peptidoglycan/LPS O-acetylase OafA/YrhL
VLCYLIFPLAVPWLARVNHGGVAIGLSACSIIVTALILDALDVPAMYYATQINWGVVRLIGEFVAGCWLYRAFAAGFGRQWNWDWVAIGSALLLVPSALVWSALPVLLLVALVYALAQGGRLIEVFFSNRAAVALGELAFSIYLVHWFVISNLGGFVRKLIGPMSLGIGLALMLFITMVISVFTYYCVERPARRIIRQMLGG